MHIYFIVQHIICLIFFRKIFRLTDFTSYEEKSKYPLHIFVRTVPLKERDISE